MKNNAPPLNIKRRLLAYSREPYQVHRKDGSTYLRRKAWEKNTPEGIKDTAVEFDLREWGLVFVVIGAAAAILKMIKGVSKNGPNNRTV